MNKLFQVEIELVSATCSLRGALQQSVFLWPPSGKLQSEITSYLPAIARSATARLCEKQDISKGVIELNFLEGVCILLYFPEKA